MTVATAMRLTDLQTALQRAGLTAQRGVPLRLYTSFRIGGPADLLITVHTIDDLARALIAAHEHGVPWWVLGGGTNVLVSDAGVRGLTILNRCRRVEIRADRRIYVESGAPLAGLARETIQASLSGLEWAIGVPGTIGGAIVGNAGAHGGCIADHLHAIEMLHPTGERAVYPAEELGLSYRSSRLKTGELRGVILSATFQMLPEAPEVLRERAEAYLAHRRKSQPVDASAGSIFRNPPGDFAGRLIEEAGLKGAREGAAQISPIHANFIVNLGGATAADVIRLIRRAQSAVYERFGVRLEPEIQMVGDWGIRDWEIRD